MSPMNEGSFAVTSQSPRGWTGTLWLLPAVAIVLAAGAGQLMGVTGVVLVAGAVVAASGFWFAEAIGSRTTRRLTIVAVMIGMVGVAVLFGWQGALPWSQTTTPTSGLQDYRARPVTQADTGKLRGALLAGADLRTLDLTGRSLAGAVAPGVVLTKVSLVGANLRSADLRGADLQNADLRGACLAGADLTGAQLTGARIDGATFDRPPPSAAGVTGTAADQTKPAPSCVTS